MAGTTPTYEQRTRAPRAVSLPTVRPGPETPLPNFEQAGAAIAGNIAAYQQRVEQSAFMTAETNIAQQKRWEADRLREIETLPSAEVQSATEELEKESREAWGQIRSKAGERGRVRHTVDMMAEGHEAEVAERLDRIRATAHGVLTAEKFDAAIADRARAVEANPESYSRNLAEATFNADHSLVDQRAQSAMRAELNKTLSLAALRGAVEKDAAAVAADLKAENPKAPYIAALAPELRAQYLPLIEKKVADDRAILLTDRIAGQFRAVGPDAGQLAMQALEASTETDAVKDRVRTEVRARTELLRVERRQQHKDQLIAVQRAIASDRAGPATERSVHRLYAAGALSTEEYASTLASIDRSALSQAKEGAAATEIMAALKAGLPLDPNDKDHRKYLAAAFATTVTETAPAGSGPWRSAAQAMAQTTRMLPDQAIAWTRQAMRSPNPEFAVTAAQFFGSIQSSVPDAVSGFDDDTKAFASVVNSMIESGAQPDKAVETARANVFDLKPEIVKQRGEAYREHEKGSDNVLSDLIDQDFDPGWFGTEPSTSLALSADFNAQASRYFKKTGDIELARKLAWTDLKRVYGVTEVNGSPMLVAFPPERFGARPDEIRADIAGAIKDHPQSDGSTVDEIFVVPDSLTLRTTVGVDGAIQRPSYKLVTKSGDLAVDSDGIPLRYTVPSNAEITKRVRAAQAEAAARAQAQIDEARKMRESRSRFRQTLNSNGIAWEGVGY